MTYHVDVTREGPHWLATVRDLPGAHTHADAAGELMRRVREVVALVLDDPGPRALAFHWPDEAWGVPATPPIQSTMHPGVTRIELIDTTGRVFSRYYEPGVEVSLQDGGRTLKVFAGDSMSFPEWRDRR